MNRYSAEQKAFLAVFIPGHTDKQASEEFNSRFNTDIMTEGKIKSYKHNNKIKSGTKKGNPIGMREDIQIFMREDIQIQTIVLIIIESLMFLLSYIGLTYSVHKINESHDYKTRKELELLKKKYIENRKQILDKHNYRYSIYERSFSINARCKVIVREIMCNEFTVNSQGQAFITYSESDFILKETEPLKIEYHHITDNKDGHILTVKELKNFIAEE